MLYFFMVAHKAARQTLSKAFLKSMKTWRRSCWCWRYFSQRICRLKICSMVLLPALKHVASVCSVRSSAWLYLGDWWGWLFGSSGTAAGCLSWEVWWPFPVCQILLQFVMTAVIASSSPVLSSSAGMLSTPADFPFFSDCTAASTSLRRMGWSFSVSAWGQPSTDGSPLALWLYSSVQYSVHRFSISRFLWGIFRTDLGQ